MEKKFNYLYKITNLVNGKFYYGIHSTDNLDDGYMGSGKNLIRAYEKYGIDNFKKEILEFRDTRDEISNLENKIVSEDLIKNPNCYNIILGGDGWRTLGTAIMIDKNGNIKRVVVGSDEYNNMQGITKGLHHSEETKKKISNHHKKVGHQKGEKNSQFGTCWITNGEENKKIKKEELNNYLNDGWKKGKTCEQPVIGILKKEEILKLLKQGLSYSDISKMYNVNKNTLKHYISDYNCVLTCFIHKDNEEKKIKKEELNNYLNDGWKKGKLITKCWVHNNKENKYINSLYLDEYLNNGWIKGRNMKI